MIKSIYIVFCIFIFNQNNFVQGLFKNYSKSVISKTGGDTTFLVHFCTNFANIKDDQQALDEIKACEECQTDKMSFEYEKQSFKNAEQYNCYSKCLYTQIQDQKKSQFTDTTFHFLQCMRIKIQNLTEFKKQKKVYIQRTKYLYKIKNVFHKLKNWQVLQDQSDTEFDLKWMQHYRLMKLSDKGKYQIINKLGNEEEIMGSKVGMLNTFQTFDLEDKYDIKSSEFIPQSFVIDLNITQTNISQQEANLYNQNDTYWIVKAPSGFGGDGIALLKTIDEVKQNIIHQKKEYMSLQQQIEEEKQLKQQELEMNQEVEDDKESQDNNSQQTGEQQQENAQQQQQKKKKLPSVIDSNLVVQKYIERPLLSKRKKFDIRTYGLIICTDPYVVLYHSGYFRKTLYDYKQEIYPWNLQQQAVHLTNSHIQTQTKNYRQGNKTEHGAKENFEWDILREEYNLSEEKLDSFQTRMHHITAYLYTASKEKLIKRPGSFLLMGNDFMMDADFNMVLLEANCNVGLYERFSGEKAVTPGIGKDAINFALDVLEENEDKEDLWRLFKYHEKYFDFKDWKILINEAADYNVLDTIKKDKNNEQKQQQQQQNKESEKQDL